MTKTERLVYLTRLLHSGKSYSIDEISVHCRTSRRTAYRDMGLLSDLNFMVDNSGGYCLKAGSEGDNPAFTPLELELIGFSLKCSPLNKIGPFNDAIRNIEAKLMACQKPKRVGTLNSHITGRNTPQAMLEKSEEIILKKFTQAMMTGQKIRVSLSDSKSPCVKARATKMKLSGRRVLLYLTCEDNHKGMVLKPEDIRNLMILSK